MDKLKEYRKEIESIDTKLIELLEKRMVISKAIGKYKFENNLDVTDLNREKELLNKTLGISFPDEIESIYRYIMNVSKDVQKYDYFLIGKSLVYSFSPKIYQSFGLQNYNLYQTDAFPDLKKLQFKGINITNPFKEEAYQVCDVLSDEAKLTKVVNTIVSSNQLLYGYNTDYFGFSNLLDHFKIQVQNKKVLIIGNGATSRTIHQVLIQYEPAKISHIVRTLRNSEEALLIDYLKFFDYDYIINATSYGTYPSNQSFPLFKLDQFRNLKAVIDVVYNPISSPILVEAKSLNIKAINGLYMLVSQAFHANRLFTKNETFNIDFVYQKIKQMMINIVLIGMPFSGKTYNGKKLSLLLDKKLIDIDEELKKEDHDLTSILNQNESASLFRDYEAKKTIEYANQWNLIISTGGGIVLNSQVMKELKNSGIIIFIDTDIDTLVTRIDNTRPLVKNKEDLIKIYRDRISLYKQYADITIEDANLDNMLMEKIHEIIDNKWS